MKSWLLGAELGHAFPLLVSNEGVGCATGNKYRFPVGELVVGEKLRSVNPTNGDSLVL